MRQTSRAVALLLVLESAQAAAQVPIASQQTAVTSFNIDILSTNTEQLTNRKAPYAMRLVTVASTASTWSALVVSKSVLTAATITSQDAITKLASSECMHCLNKAGVWCSRTYSYNVTTGTATLAASTAKNMYTTVATSNAELTAGQFGDNGSCCGTTDQFNDWVGALGTPAVLPILISSDTTGSLNSGSSTGQPFVSNACIATSKTATGGVYTGTSNAFGTTAFETGNAAYTSWWCSNGLYKNVTTATSATTINISTMINTSTNQRKELAQVACPQISTWCGTNVVFGMTTANSISATPAQIEIITGTALTTSSKCTWLAHAVMYAPTFTISKGAAAGPGLATQNWTIHHMEYTAQTAAAVTTGSLAIGSTTAGAVAGTEGLNVVNYVPLFTMPAAQFATLRTWYGAGFTTLGTPLAGTSTVLNTELPNWFAPYQNSALTATALSSIAGQYYGNVANFPSSNYSAATPTATSSYGLTSSVKFDVRVVRYFPAQVAQMSWATGTAAATLYASKLTSYNTAKATWDAYVAILAKNAKTDAFAAAFSPPKAPTVPPLPNMPWTPATYSGYVKQTPQQASIQAANTTYASAAQPTNQQFWLSLSAAQSIGGWGSFTAQLLTFRSGWGKSFGTIGYSGDANKETMSQVWNYKWMCIAAASGTTALPSKACDATYVTSANALAATVPYTTTAINAVKFMVVISLWSNGNTVDATAVWTTKQSFGLNWKASAFADTLQGLQTIAAPTPATAASSLTGLAGAQALAASTAAALAAAAALY